MKNKVVIQSTDGLYFAYEDDSIYFVEKKYISNSDNMGQLFIIGIALVISLFIPYFFKGCNLKDTELITFLTIAYVLYFYIAIYLVVKLINANYIKRYDCYKYLIGIKMKKSLVSMTKKAGTGYSIISVVFIIGALWIYYLFLTTGDLKYLSVSAFIFSGTFSFILPFVRNMIKIHIRLTKELTE